MIPYVYCRGKITSNKKMKLIPYYYGYLRSFPFLISIFLSCSPCISPFCRTSDVITFVRSQLEDKGKTKINLASH